MNKPSAQSITIVQLYPHDMNIYGDNGNVLVLKKRLEWRGIHADIVPYNVGDTLPDTVDIIIGGGGQDSGQDAVHADLLSIAPRLRNWAKQGTPMLLVCGLYQLFGHSFTTNEGRVLKGIDVFDATTSGTNERLIGNIITHNESFGTIIGYENHSGQTHLGPDALPFASVIRGAGNNASDGHEGARYKNVIGTYLHGSLLPKNPAIADFLLQAAGANKYGDSFTLSPLDDSIADQARHFATQRPR